MHDGIKKERNEQKDQKWKNASIGWCAEQYDCIEMGG